ncbi:MAG: phage holin family protein [Spirochaetes bacterium]|nr:phage holin family protein [Spirochaetota bacterium]
MLRRILWSIIVNSLALWVTSLIVRGLQFTGAGAIIVTALILGVINAVVKPILNFLALPLTILTLGLFMFIVNAISLEIVASLSPGFSITSFWSAIVGAVVLSIFTTIFNWLLFPKEVRG